MESLLNYLAIENKKKRFKDSGADLLIFRSADLPAPEWENSLIVVEAVRDI